jgi:16S rRNA G966 N2-methylase RsmD
MTHLRYEDRSRIQATDAYRWARAFTAIDDEPMVVLLDPPYREYEIHPKKLNQLLETLVQKLPAGSFVAVESGRTLDDRILPEFDAWDVRRYGGTQIAVREVGAGPGVAETTADEADGPTHDDL